MSNIMDLHELAKQFAEKEKLINTKTFNETLDKYASITPKSIPKTNANRQIYENAEKFNINIASFLIELLNEHKDAKPCKYCDCTTCIHHNPDLGCKEEDDYEWVDKETVKQLLSGIFKN